MCIETCLDLSQISEVRMDSVTVTHPRHRRRLGPAASERTCARPLKGENLNFLDPPAGTTVYNPALPRKRDGTTK